MSIFQFNNLPNLSQILNAQSVEFTVNNTLLANVCASTNPNSSLCELFIPLTLTTNLDVILANIKTPLGYSGPYISGWGYSTKVGCFKSVYIGNICDLFANPGVTISPLSGLTSNGYIYGFTIGSINVNAKLHIGFILSYYNTGATYGETTLPSGCTVFENNVNKGVHYLYTSSICPYLKNDITTILTPYQTFSYSYFGCTGSYVNSLPGFTGLYPVTGLHTQYGYSSADPSHVPFDILLDYLQDL